MKFILKWMMALFVLSVILFGGLAWYLTYGNFDIDSQDYSDLKVERYNIPDEKNGFFVYREAFSKISDEKELGELYRNKEATEDELTVFLNENKLVIELCNQASELDFEEPDIKTFNDNMSYLSEFRALTKLYVLRLRIKPDVKVYLQCSAFAQRYAQNSEVLISYLVAIAMQGMLDPSLESFLMQEENRGGLQKLIVFHQQCNDGAFLKHAMKGEFEYSSSVFPHVKNATKEEFWFTDDLVLSGTRVAFLFQEERTKKLLADQFRELIRLSSSSESPIQELEKFDEIIKKEFSALPKYRKLNNRVGKILIDMIMPAMNKTFRKMLQLKARRSLIITAAAIRLYDLDHGQKPESLSQLVPMYLKEIPKDPFDGQDIRYDAKRMVVYSIGMDGKDDGGAVVKSPTYRSSGDQIFPLGK